jgi:hypothetical protein
MQCLRSRLVEEVSFGITQRSRDAFVAIEEGNGWVNVEWSIREA